MPDSDITKIESKVNIAADAGIAIHAYLEELNEKLVSYDVEKAYSIVADYEERIVEIVTAQGSSVKLGTDVVMGLIQNEFGTPDDVIKLYVDIKKMTITHNSIGSLSSNATVLQRREIKTDRGGFSNVLQMNFWVFGIVGLLLSAVLVVFSNTFYYDREAVFFAAFANMTLFLIFIFIEIKAGRRSKLHFKLWVNVGLRYLVRGLMLMSVFISYLSAAIRQDFRTSSRGEVIFIFWVNLIGFIIYEITIYIRDHKVGRYPLEPHSRPIIRYFTLPYIVLISAGLITLMINWNNGELSVLSVSLAFFAGILVLVRRHPVTARFYILAYTFQIAPVLAYGFYQAGFMLFLFPTMILLVEFLRALLFGPTTFSKVYAELGAVFDGVDKF